jgi:hypothetical protein
MREQLKELERRYPHLARAVVVYDVFSTKGAPQGETITAQALGLQPRERAWVVRGDRIVDALGPAFADMRQVKRRRAGEEEPAS